MSVRKALKKYSLQTAYMKDITDPSRFCKVCGKPLIGNQKIYCSPECKAKNYYKNSFSNLISTQEERAKGRKLYFVKIKGGKCEKCGYNKNLAALSFHHLDGKQKTMALTTRAFASCSLEKIKEEADKCILLCANCHAELHHSHLQMELVENDEKVVNYQKANNLLYNPTELK